MRPGRLAAVLVVLAVGLLALVGLLSRAAVTEEREAFLARVQSRAAQLGTPALASGESACLRRGAIVAPVSGSGCDWFIAGTTSGISRAWVIAVVPKGADTIGLRVPAAALNGRVAVTRALAYGGGLLLFLVLAVLLRYWGNADDDRTATTTALLEALASGDLSARAAEVGSDQQRRTLAAANAVAERLQVTVERQRTFLADAAHQLRNPLLALQLRLENLEPHVMTAGRRGHARLSHDVKRLGITLDELVSFARAAEADGEPREVDVLAVVDERLRAWVPVAHSRRIVLRQLLPAHAVALSRPGALEQSLDVLVHNALKHAPSRSEVTVVVVPTPTYVEVRVEDRGRGLPAGAQAAASVRGWRQDPRASGTGLGLAIATLLLSSSGGSLQLSDRRDGTGLSAALRLPTPAPSVNDELLPAWRQQRGTWDED